MSRSGLPVLKQNDKWLASSFDPMKEAKQWAEAVGGRCNGAQSVVVLGSGSGYHVFELVKLLKGMTIVVIEPNDVRLKELENLFPHIYKTEKLNFVVEADVLKMTSHSAIQDL
jgi:threonine dehydrogenase-like Zn-dependent dehydrogenase